MYIYIYTYMYNKDNIYIYICICIDIIYNSVYVDLRTAGSLDPDVQRQQQWLRIHDASLLKKFHVFPNLKGLYRA